MRRAVRVLGAAALVLFLAGLGWLGADRSAQAQEGETEPIGVLVQLADAPSAQVYADALERRATLAQATAAAQTQFQRIESSQRALLADPTLQQAQFIYRTQRIYNGIALYIDPALRGQIAELPGVLAVHPLPVQTIETVRAVPFLGAPALWNQVYPGGLSGESVSIGIIDTGIDYLHRDFAGPGTGYSANDSTVITDILAGITFPTARVVGGYDFAGDKYDVRPGGNPIPQPDPDPMDCWGHGTHVAGIAGGSGVLWQGSAAYTGVYTEGLSFSQFAIGPGVAPRAKLYALKVFGCTGASNLVPAALEWAVDPNGDGDFSDHLDVVNLSVGSSYGSYDDPSSIAADNATLAGVIVVAAAGNSGDAYYIVNSPGVADRTISVAATSLAGLASAETAGDPSAAVDTVASFSARGPRRGDAALKPEIAAPGVSISSAARGTGVAAATYSGTSMATPFVAGAAALLRQLHPTWTVEEIKALLLNTARYNVTVSDQQPSTLYGAGRSGAGRMDIGAAAQAGVIVYNASNAGQVSLSYGSPEVQGTFQDLKNLRLVNKSPITQSIFLKYVPVVDIPGAEFSVLGGPTAQLLPYNSLNIAVLFNAQADQLPNAGDPTVALQGLFPRHILREETGFVYVWPQQTRVQARLSGHSLLAGATTDVTGLLDGILSPETGQLTYTLTLSASAQLTVTSADLHLGQFYANGPRLQSLGIKAVSSQSSVTATGAVTLTQEAMTALAANGVYLLIEADGYFNGAARGQVETVDNVLRLPVYAAPRPISSMRTTKASLDYGAVVSGVQTIQMVGQGLLSAPSLQQAAFPTDTVSVVAALELQYSSPNEESSTGLLEHGDLKYVGVGSDIAASGGLESAKIVFGLVTYGDWSSPNEVLFQVHIDRDGDGTTDFILRSGNVTEFSSSASKDEFISILEEARTGALKLAHFRNLVSRAELDTAVFNNSSLLLAVDAADIGLTPLSSSFSYSITTQSIDSDDRDEIIDRSPLLFYDVMAPGIRVENGLANLPLFYDLPGTTIAVEADRDRMAANRSRGVLLLHLHNGIGERSEEVEVRFGSRLFIPQVWGGSGE
ncbi:MAG: S8 family serine peptidase [Caldilineaceae bacterium]